MSAAPYVLARTLSEAHAFARGDLGLAPGHYRVVNSPASLKSVRGVDLYLVPGWQNRYDRFAMKGAIRWTRMNVINAVDPAEEPVVTDGLMPEGVQLALMTPDEATAFFTATYDDNAELQYRLSPEGREYTDRGSIEEIAEVLDRAEAPDSSRRRSRCKDCGALHYRDEACATLEGV